MRFDHTEPRHRRGVRALLLTARARRRVGTRSLSMPRRRINVVIIDETSRGWDKAC
jgi:hypothetical protein